MAKYCCFHVMQVEVKGLVLVGVSLAREIVPSFARVLLHTTLGRHMLRPLLRSEIAQVTTRRAWHDASKLTSETLDLYKVCLHTLCFLSTKMSQACYTEITQGFVLLFMDVVLLQAPLHVENWDKALSEVSKATSATAMLSSSNAADLVRCVANLPALVVAGIQDNLVPIKSAQHLASQLPGSVCLLLHVGCFFQVNKISGIGSILAFFQSLTFLSAVFCRG